MIKLRRELNLLRGVLIKPKVRSFQRLTFVLVNVLTTWVKHKLNRILFGFCSLRLCLHFSVFQYNKPSETVIPESVDGLQENLDVVVSLAERHYYNCDFKMCYKLTSV